MRLELTCVCSLNDFQLVIGLYRGYTLFFSEYVYLSLLPTENHSNYKYEWIQVSLSTPLTRPCTIYVFWQKQQAGNIHICENKVNRKKYKSLCGPTHFKIFLFSLWTYNKKLYIYIYIYTSISTWLNVFKHCYLILII